MYLLDTVVIDALLEGDVKASKFYADHDPSLVFVSSVCIFEIINGFNQKILEENAKFIKGKPNTLLLAYRSLSTVLPALVKFPVKQFDDAALAVYQTLPPKLRQSAKSNDARIASVAIVNGLILVTRNVKDFQAIREVEADLDIDIW